MDTPSPARPPAGRTGVRRRRAFALGTLWMLGAFGALCALGMALAGCATAGRGAGAAAEGQPWRIPDEAYGTQRLYRVSYKGPQGEGSFRLTLRLASAERYQVQAVDPVGRALWSLDVESGRGLWLDHRARVYCTLEGDIGLSGVPLAPFPLLSLPPLLLGRVPAEPAAPPRPLAGGGIAFEDGEGRRWEAAVRDGRVERWTLWKDAEPAVWWVLRNDWAILSDRTQGAQLRWRETVGEPLEQAPRPLEVPAGFREESCRGFDSPPAPL